MAAPASSSGSSADRVLAGIAAGFAGGWWGHLWIWLALAIFVVVGLVMMPLTPMTERKLHAMRRAGGLGIESPFGIGHWGEAPPANPEELQRRLAAWNPMPTSLLGFGAFIAILALMLLKPF